VGLIGLRVHLAGMGRGAARVRGHQIWVAWEMRARGLWVGHYAVAGLEIRHAWWLHLRRLHHIRHGLARLVHRNSRVHWLQAIHIRGMHVGHGLGAVHHLLLRGHRVVASGVHRVHHQRAHSRRHRTHGPRCEPSVSVSLAAALPVVSPVSSGLSFLSLLPVAPARMALARLREPVAELYSLTVDHRSLQFSKSRLCFF
jgi:hypothetical protein